MRITRKRLKEHTEVVDYVCNKCGSFLSRGETGEGEKYAFMGIPNFTYTGGYHSGSHDEHTSKLQDCESYTFSLCEDCLSNLFDEFIIPPATQTPIAIEDRVSYLREELQVVINKVYAATKEELAVYATDENELVRKFAEARLRKEKK